ncbi:class I SAM-dependent methyltransferase [Aspergillus clavatus NRRL 1]|uniref:Methyltransferase, putative n=1 Tax=Aspergillus clavatus (strain ATCC 1007 / CBS 513.65 / DSM 816 / NCTC 3887 / NRRL 1 / QM 1276 / 107) TaxID=344612 RepID=A1C7A4_ASPCL|nr:methyltransferase, putative [Aspergillus clavatus NRRL 1]EAW14275.1 methyltransferase, putative [Aspergillus clavatus NRRL 1]
MITPLSGNDRFNAEAANWDSNPSVQEATRQAFETTLQPLITTLSNKASNGLDVLEVGCGTGLLTLRVAPLVKEIVAIDTADGMIEMLKAKLTTPDAPKNVVPICHLLEDPEDAVLPTSAEPTGSSGRRKFDLIVSHLVMHHVPDLKAFLATLRGCLKSGGRVALTDFEDFGPEARKFHPKDKLKGVERHGIPREWMEELMREVGFEEVKVWVGWTLDKEVEDWEDGKKETMQFPFLVCEGVCP